ncbi:MAG: tetratricopeptide repeat protein [Chloroflexi bacterium]|nr:tetratricopeptide repeat protein [Chloroflexota bacterium]
MSATPQSPPLNRETPSPPPQTSQTVRLVLGTLLTGALAVLTYAVTPTLIGLAAMQRGAAALTVAERVEVDPETLSGPIGDLRDAAALLPTDPLPLRYLARAYQQSGRQDEAIATLERAASLAPNSLLVRKELMLAYQAAGRLEQAAQLEAQIGYTPERMIAIGDSYRRNGDHVEALRWYDIARARDPSLGSQLAFRQLLSAASTGDPRAQTFLREVQAVLPDLVLPHVGTAGVVVPGALLRWVEVYPQLGITYGTPLNHTHGGTDGVLWGNGHATLLIAVDQPGDYVVRVTTHNGNPPPVELALGVNGRPLQQVALTAGDDTWSVLEYPITLKTPLASLDVWFLNDGMVQGIDRNAVISQIDIQFLSVIP